LITGPAGDEAAADGVAGVAAWALQPARTPAVMNAEAAPMISLRRKE